MEEWKDIKGYEGIYQVSNQGNVKSLDRYILGEDEVKYFRKGTLIKFYETNGYLRVNLHKNCKTEKMLVHRIVAMAFIPNPNNLPEINHMDENRKNNYASNLEWCDRNYNLHYGTCMERRINSMPKKEFYQKDMNGNIIKKWRGLKEFERKTGMYARMVRKCCKGEKKSYKGYLWEYA